MGRPASRLMSREVSREDLSMRQIKGAGDSSKARRRPARMIESESSNQLTLPSALVHHMKQSSSQRDSDDDDTDGDSLSDSDSSYHRQDSYGLLDDDPALPAYPSPPVQEGPEEAFSSFPLPPALVPTTVYAPPQMIVSPPSVPASPRSTAQYHFHTGDEDTEDDDDDTKPT